MTAFATEVYTNAVVGAGLAQAQANIDQLTALIANPGVAPAAAGKRGNFDLIPPAAAEQLRAELAALRASFVAA